MILLMIIGGGIGSTAGGIKLGRVCRLMKNLAWNIKKKMIPDRTVTLTYYCKGTEKELLDLKAIGRIICSRLQINIVMSLDFP